MTQFMPPNQPLAHPKQNLRRDYHDQQAPDFRPTTGVSWWRGLVFVPAFLTTFGLIMVFTDFFAMDGLTWFETGLITLIALTFFWISLSVSTVTAGILNLLRPERPRAALNVTPLKTALLVPVYNEDPIEVFGNAAAMLNQLNNAAHVHDFTLFILSDTRDDMIALKECQAFAELRSRMDGRMQVYYRRRADNTDRKVGNLADWVEHWGGGYEAMLVLDADSLMSAEAIIALTDEMSADSSAGLIQSVPQLFGADTLFGRVQQFSNTVYGAVLAEGLAKWADREGNYWGHNAIIRTAAFAASAGLPKLDTFRSKGALILSHDFVEAGLLRRAGWAVRFLPRVKGSYEEVPGNLIDYVRRDRRWCQGNLQHLNILGSKGFHTVTRFHLFHGAMSYLLSPAWFILLAVWAVIGVSAEENVITYFTGDNPQVAWPEIGHANNLFILFFMYGMLLAPKFLGATAIGRTGVSLRDLGGPVQFVFSFVTEIVVSVLFAPILMVQQTLAVARTYLGFKEKWIPQSRHGARYSLLDHVKFHAAETIIGAALVFGMYEGIITLWLSPIAISLLGAVFFSYISGVKLDRFEWTRRQMGTAEVFNAPSIIRAAKRERLRLKRALDEADHVPAE